MAKRKACARPGKLGSRTRGKLPDRAFGLPSQRKYPMYRVRGGRLIPDPTHASNAKGRALTAYNQGHITLSQYRQIVRKANKVLGECAANISAEIARRNKRK